MSEIRRKCLITVFGALMAVVTLIQGTQLVGQTSNASLAGAVEDQTQGRIPGAKVTLENQESKDKRSTVSNSDGDFNFSGVAAGVYTLTVTYKGFETFVEQDISLHPGDTSTLPPLQLKVGAEDVVITVTAHDVISNDGEVSSLITSEDIKHLATEGRDVTELVKILPGFALQPGASNNNGLSNAAPDSEVVGPGGSLGNYAANGSPSSGVGLISDGANVQDPGAGGATTQSINMDMVEEVKVSTANFGADSAHGPVVINAVGKAGGQNYHGSIYIIARTYQLNSQDWLVKNQGQPKPHDRYLYPGFTIGGPIRIPGTNFNSNKKLLFLVGGEDYIQRNAFLGGNGAAALKLSTVPTDAMRNGDFSPASIANMFNVSQTDLATNCNSNNTNGTLYQFLNFCQSPAAGAQDSQGNTLSNGVFPAADIDPGSAVYLQSLFPHQNRTAQAVAGTQQESDAFDRIDTYLTNYDLYQVRGRIDFNPTQSNKFYAVYNVERGYSYNPFTLYGNLSYQSGELRDPSLIKSGTNSQTASFNYVHIFSPRLTSEAFGAASYYFNSFNPANENVQTRASLGYPYLSYYNNGSQQIPQLGYGNNSGIPLYAGPDFSFGQSYSRKISLDAGDNLTWVIKQHTIKLGIYYERVSNNQLSASGATQGTSSEYGTYGCFYSPGFSGGTKCNGTINNTMAMFLMGYQNYYGQQSNSVPVDMFYNTLDGYVTDAWKILHNLTLDFGVRFDHLGPWVDPHNIGAAFWFPQNYTTSQSDYGSNGVNSAPCTGGPGVPAGCIQALSVAQFPGISWHGKDPSVMNAVEKDRWAFVSPRVGFSYDPYGGGRTVFTGGAGLYRSHDSWNNYVGALNTAVGTITTYVNGITNYCVDAIGRGTTANTAACARYGAKGSNSPAVQTFSAFNSPSVTVADPNDNQQPLTFTYSFGVNQSIKHAGNLVLNFVGNKSTHLLLSGGYAGNVNVIPLGGLFTPDPNAANTLAYGQIPSAPDAIGQTVGGVTSTALVDDWRPYPFYNGINVIRHQLSSNYNSFQTTWSKWTGKAHYNINYTWSKALGQTSGPDGTNTRNDYGILSFDRTNVFNASYTYIEGKQFHVNRVASAFINNWEISGITNVQSGPNLQAAYSPNFQLTAIGTTGVGSNATTVANTTTAYQTDNRTYLGTPDISLQPIMICDPGANLKAGQFINSACLTLGPQGVNGPFHYPYLRGPHFFNSDLSAQKGFKFSGKKEVTFRFAAFNFMNHPLTSLVAATASPLKLVIAGPGGAANSAFGISDYKENRRVCEVVVRFNF